MKIRRMITVVCMSTVMLANALPVNAENERLDIHAVLQVGDIYENSDCNGFAVKEIVTEIHEDGTFETQSVGEMLEKSKEYRRVGFDSEEKDVTVYSNIGEKRGYFMGSEDGMGEITCEDVIRVEMREEYGVKEVEKVIAMNDKGDVITEQWYILLDE